MAEYVHLVERLVRFGNRTYMESGLDPGIWREVPVVWFDEEADIAVWHRWMTPRELELLTRKDPA